MIKGQGGQAIGCQMVNATTGAAFTGAVTVYVTIDAGVQAIGSVGAGICTHEGNGYHTYAPSAAETAGDLLAFTFIGTGAIPQTVQIATVTAAQVASLQAVSGVVTIAMVDLLVDAATEIQVARAGGKLEPGVAAWMLRKFNRLIDRWNATPGATFDQPLQSFVPIAGHQPHTLGPSAADWVLSESRPNKIVGANVILNTVTPNVRIPIRVHNDQGQWWQGVPVQGLSSSIVTDLYFESAYPNGKVWLWPVPNSVYPIELRFDDAFAAYGINDTVALPPGYVDACVLSLAETCAPGLGQTVSEQLKLEALDARVTAFGVTLPDPPSARTRDGGMPGARSGRSWLYRTGLSKS